MNDGCGKPHIRNKFATHRILARARPMCHRDGKSVLHFDRSVFGGRPSKSTPKSRPVQSRTDPAATSATAPVPSACGRRRAPPAPEKDNVPWRRQRRRRPSQKSCRGKVCCVAFSMHDTHRTVVGAAAAFISARSADRMSYAPTGHPRRPTRTTPQFCFAICFDSSSIVSSDSDLPSRRQGVSHRIIEVNFQRFISVKLDLRRLSFIGISHTTQRPREI